MTAEISIMNRNAVAMAADSAVTISGESGPKIFTSANKIFQLSKYRPVGVMIYQNSKFLGIPWETIIKQYREHIRRKKFSTLNEYAEDFINYLEERENIFSDQQKEKYFTRRVSGYYFEIVTEVFGNLEEKIMHEKEATEDDVKDELDNVIEEHYQFWKESNLIPSLKDKSSKVEEIENQYKSNIDEIKQNVFEKLPITSAQSRKLTIIAYSLYTKFPKEEIFEDYTGIVFAGFGENEIFPSLKSYLIEGILGNTLKYKTTHDSEITVDNQVSIIPFAQGDMVHSFMEGIDPHFLQAIKNDFFEIIKEYPGVILEQIPGLKENQVKKSSQKIRKAGISELKKRLANLENYSNENFIGPIVEVVSTLPKPELASMAESLVNLTNLRRKISMKAETVGGPIDVAVISKGDGFIWIKRKHYFDPKFNHHFFDNYYMWDEDESSN